MNAEYVSRWKKNVSLFACNILEFVWSSWEIPDIQIDNDLTNNETRHLPYTNLKYDHHSHLFSNPEAKVEILPNEIMEQLASDLISHFCRHVLP